ncbi:MAG: hypothetical protein BGN87_16230 [Rhizobiales bacterium 65-79]|jgi:hypothetical protein|nr:hypothetical protein [Hyphomicrobiales bacterium]MBN9079773.1 hypothetical protein [Hyphomicrobiales bacterium]OJU03060.1 MAG: hypothetical protein BGN87_16230 [Rhizobiales bacterium 65-79]
MKLEDPALIKTDEQIDWLLSRSNVSPWLKNALTAARGRDPVELLNDLGILDCVLRTRCNAQVRSALETLEGGN